MEPIRKILFRTLRGCHLAASWEFEANLWFIKNPGKFVNAPLFYLSSLDCKKYYPRNGSSR